MVAVGAGYAWPVLWGYAAGTRCRVGSLYLTARYLHSALRVVLQCRSLMRGSQGPSLP